MSVWAAMKNITDWVAYKQQTFAALSSGGWPSEMSAPAWQVLVWAVFQVADFTLHPQMVDGAQECGGFFYKSTSSTHEGSTLVTQAPRQNPTSKHYHPWD